MPRGLKYECRESRRVLDAAGAQRIGDPAQRLLSDVLTRGCIAQTPGREHAKPAPESLDKLVFGRSRVTW
jgi:hypothetical protein